MGAYFQEKGGENIGELPQTSKSKSAYELASVFPPFTVGGTGILPNVKILYI